MNRSLQICILVALYLITLPYIPSTVPTLFYTLSVLIKDLLLWMLPITVCFFIAYAISSFEKKALAFLLSLIVFETISNTVSIWYSYGCAHFVPTTSFEIQSNTNQFEPYFKLYIPSFWSADKGTIVGLFLGLSSSFFNIKNGIKKGKEILESILTKVFARLIPLFVLGFVAKMEKGNILSSLASESLPLLITLLFFLFLYIFFLFFLGGGGMLTTVQRVKNLLPATFLAFSSGCSLSTMPWTISGTAKNLKNPELAKGVIPATTNIQQVGDCIVNGFFCFLLYTHFNGHSPDLFTWAKFSFAFVLARFATAAVIGGAIFLMLPIYETYLGFTPEMIALILALNVLLDPIVTASNVMANGALCRVFERYWLTIQERFRLQVH